MVETVREPTTQEQNNVAPAFDRSTRAAPEFAAQTSSRILNNSANTPPSCPDPYSPNLATNAITIWFGTENVDTLVKAIRAAFYKRGVPEQLLVANGSIYCSREITLICARVGCLLRPTAVRDAKPPVRFIIYAHPSATNHGFLATDSGRFAILFAPFGVLFAPFRVLLGSF